MSQQDSRTKQKIYNDPKSKVFARNFAQMCGSGLKLG